MNYQIWELRKLGKLIHLLHAGTPLQFLYEKDF